MNEIVVRYRGIEREYTREIHGENFQELANQFANKMGGEVINNDNQLNMEENTNVDAPVEDAPVEDAPVEDAPVEDAPVEDAPVVE